MELDTLGNLIEAKHNLQAFCNTCRHCVRLDIPALIAKLGPDHGCLHKDLVPKLKCSSCGSKDIALILTSDSAEGSLVG